MFNPLKMGSDDKKMLLGGIASGLIYWGNFMARTTYPTQYPAELKQQLEPHLPPNGDLLATLAPAAVLYGIVRFGKKGGLRKVAKGAILFDVPNVIGRTAVQTAWTEGRKIAPTATFPFATSQFQPESTPSTPSSVSKYVTTAPIIGSVPQYGTSKYTITG